jgi:hypothetical protein
MMVLMKCIHQEQYRTNSYNKAKNDGIPSFAKVNSLKQTIDNGKSIRDVVNLGL